MARPRKYPTGLTAAEYEQARQQDRAEAGTVIRRLTLLQEAVDALALLRQASGEKSDSATVSRLLIREASQLARREV